MFGSHRNIIFTPHTNHKSKMSIASIKYKIRFWQAFSRKSMCETNKRRIFVFVHKTAQALDSCTNTHLMRNVAIKGFSLFFLFVFFFFVFVSLLCYCFLWFFFVYFIDYRIPKCNTDKQTAAITHPKHCNT